MSVKRTLKTKERREFVLPKQQCQICRQLYTGLPREVVYTSSSGRGYGEFCFCPACEAKGIPITIGAKSDFEGNMARIQGLMGGTSGGVASAKA